MTKHLLSLLLAAACLAGPARAQSAADAVTAGLMPGWRMESGRHMAALHLKLAPGWKTYWRAPGEAGIPPSFDWSGSENVAGVAIHWPVPHVFDQNGLRSVGYKGDVVMPVEITPTRPGEPIALAGRIEIGVCNDICVPVSLALDAALPAEGEGGGAEVIRAALADRPLTEDEAGVSGVVCATEPISDGLRVTVTMRLPPAGGREDAVVEFADPTVWVSEAQTRRDGGALTAVADLVPSEAAPFALSRQDLRVTVLGADHAVDIRGCTG
jgi:DsbC/DsbD-like thiol-disulfide interchange protein